MLICVFTVLILGYLSISTEACNSGEPDGVGVELLGTPYDCKYLRSYYQEDKYIGIFRSRKYHCRQPYTDCCETCNHVLSCKDAPRDGIYLAEMYYNCTSLQKYHIDDKFIGIFKNRRSICTQSTTDCCETCENIMNEIAEETTTPAVKDTTIKTIPVQQSTKEKATTVLKDTCTSGCLWVGDGSTGECSWLLDQSKSAYDVRYMLCTKGFTNGCERTCNIVITESKKNGRVENDIRTGKPTSRPACEDTVVIYKKDFYACGELLNPNSNIFNNRKPFCASDYSSCCITCQRVIREKPAGVIKYNDENQIGKNGIVVEPMPSSVQKLRQQKTKTNNPPTSRMTSAPPATNQLSSLLYYLKATSEKLQREEAIRRNALNTLMSNIMATFFRIQKANNQNTDRM